MLKVLSKIPGFFGFYHWGRPASLKNRGARLLAGTEVQAITDSGVEVSREGVLSLIEADTVVPINITANRELADRFKKRLPEVYLVGDGSEPAKLQEAITAGFLAGQKI
jgi:hypothetical protein